MQLTTFYQVLISNLSLKKIIGKLNGDYDVISRTKSRENMHTVTDVISGSNILFCLE